MLELANQDKDKQKKEYIQYITEKTPWFVGDIILCLIDLAKINLLASGSYDKKIRLWDLNAKGSDKSLDHNKRGGKAGQKKN